MGRVSDARDRLMNAVRALIWEGSFGSTTIDHICDKAGVKKGSFYYFFDSKADLAVAALDAEWQTRRAELDAIFSPVVPPLDRFRKYCEYGYRLQVDIQAKCGCVLGCPLLSLGVEISTLEDKLRLKIQEILDYKRAYFESAIRDAHGAGLIHAPNPAAKARMLFAYFDGLLTEARIRNNLEALEGALSGAYELLGVTTPEPVSA
jgi:TetR/AcrR family transcriptional regulator, transcriptional repressor for nem operon